MNISEAKICFNRKLATTTHCVENLDFNFDDSFSDLQDFVWGTAEHKRRSVINQNSSDTGHNQIKNRTSSDNRIQSIETDEYNWGSKSQRTILSTISIQCSGCHQQAKQCNVKKDGPNKGKFFYVCAQTKPCNFFQWADDVSTPKPTAQSYENQTVPHADTLIPKSPLQTEIIKCKCGIAASSLIVRKEGPNKSRPFYTCSKRDASCGFFKWKDEESNPGAASSSSHVGQSSGNRQLTSKDSSKKRKCGMCRQEGHTRSKCPRESEFQN
ncbi:DNA topoisomerase 3-alpha-like [Zeugodacus cucurbitae]|uniref:DNA topoisomerase 3-alpha-like n=1 Tax=Zeugodacus cucurbitae TaxID=28588 RepID=UPI0023D919D0|nr:DNA topoisomerase 3-alpha-like [Zeugodacus cucurbitae]